MNNFQTTAISRINSAIVDTFSSDNKPIIKFRQEHVRDSVIFQSAWNRLRRSLGLTEIPIVAKELPNKISAARFSYLGHNFAIYLYDDGVDFCCDDKTMVFELPDYRSESELLDDLTDRLSKALMNPEGFHANSQDASARDWLLIGSILIGAMGVVGWGLALIVRNVASR